ncbi:YpzI family protein [Pallidibacillus pasinlerensis]|uniref:YpzI family protein n=1 Tax=Pallidibacillus pasinlerensis TaxID=2703818 RepID=A0ABX0A559_9BACI|nr:YpzI family protein [Pallidibacillus pasinlerensis]NCU18567.1 YpzI family protein [Pallidibacillus pasinlerensis]
MSKDRQETKLRKSGHVAADRDPSLEKDSATKMSSPEEARRLNDNKR